MATRTYFKIGSTDFSQYVSGLEVDVKYNYTSQTNAAGNTVVDYINKKFVVTVEFISLDAETAKTIISNFIENTCSISFINPRLNQLTTLNNVMIDDYSIEYYSIQSASNTRLKKFKVKFIAL